MSDPTMADVIQMWDRYNNEYEAAQRDLAIACNPKDILAVRDALDRQGYELIETVPNRHVPSGTFYMVSKADPPSLVRKISSWLKKSVPE